jgi:predicted nucleic acid-binding protein
MRLAVDASVLVAELFRRQGRQRLANARLELLIAEATFQEVERELKRRGEAFARQHKLSQNQLQSLLMIALATAKSALQIISDRWLEPFKRDAIWRVPQDAADWPTVALALATGADIWSEDRDYFGCGLATWTSQVLDYYLSETS